MTPVRRRAIVVAACMMSGLVVAEWVRPTRKLADKFGAVSLEDWFPKQFGDWRIDDSIPVLLPSPDVQAKLDAIYNQVLSRTYVNSTGDRVMLSIAYGGDQSDGTRAHRPEVCYPAQGFQILSSQPASLAVLDGSVLPVRRLVARLGARYEPITYWIVTGERVVTSGIEQKLAQMSYGFRGIVPDGVLFRVSSIDKDYTHAFELQQQFITDLARVLDAPVRPRVFGRSRTT